MGYWSSKVALVTGGSAGLGLAIAEALLHARAHVAIVGRNEAQLNAAVEKLESQRRAGDVNPPLVIAISADVTQQHDVERMIAEAISRFGRLDLLVNCVGLSTRGEVLTTPAEEFMRLFDVNFLSMVRCTQAAAPHLIAARGHLVNIGSLAGKLASPYLGAYPASKFAVSAFTQQLRWELQPHGVHALLVCPGPIRREDAGQRYAEQAANLPSSAQAPGGGVKLKGIESAKLAARILKACEQRQAELVVPWKAKLLIAVAQLSPRLADWIVMRMLRD